MGPFNLKIGYGLNGLTALSSSDFQDLVFRCINMIENAQAELNLPICTNLQKTKEHLHEGLFKIEPFAMRRMGRFKLEYASFKPPSTILLNSRIFVCEKELNASGIFHSLIHYSIAREILKVDEYLGGEMLLKRTMEHILNDHKDKLENGMLIIRDNGGEAYIKSQNDLANLWATQYVEMVTHYKTYIVHRYNKLPKLDFIWTLLKEELFSPSIFTCLENRLGTRGVFNIITNMVGRYCLIEALNESKKIFDQNISKYVI